MFVRQLSYLVALARERHFGRAAETCSVSQPALSAAIRNMEDELGLPIVQRRGRSFEGFTPEGERLLGWARQILADGSHLRQEASGAREGVSGRLRMGAIPMALPVVLLLTETCLAVHPRIDHVVHSLSTSEIIRQLDAFELDLGLTYLEDERLARFDQLPLYRAQSLKNFKRGAYLINTARGKLCDTHAVVAALESGRLAGYAGDVWFPRSPPQDHPWRTMPHHGMTPHISGTGLSAQTRYAAGTREIGGRLTSESRNRI